MRAPGLVVHTLMGVAAILNDQGDLAEELLGELGHQSGRPWLPVAANALTISLHHPLTAPIRIGKLMQREHISYEEKQKLAELQVFAEQNIDDPEKAMATNFMFIRIWILDVLKGVAKKNRQHDGDYRLGDFFKRRMLQRGSRFIRLVDKFL